MLRRASARCGAAGARARLAPPRPVGGRRLAAAAAAATAQGTTAQPNRLLAACLQQILDAYLAATPSAAAVVERVYRQGYGEAQLVHDHFAFRTFGVSSRARGPAEQRRACRSGASAARAPPTGRRRRAQVPGLGLESLGSALQAFGYTQQDYYTFPATHLLAAWFAPPQHLYAVLPRMFVSQLQVEKLSPAAQALIRSYTDELVDPAAGGSSSPEGAMLRAWSAAVSGALPWRRPSRADFTALLRESEYGAWVLANGFRLNHTALSVHAIAGRTGDIHSFADELAAKGFNLNQEGGVMKVSPDGGLLQCSTVADLVDCTFAGGEVHPVVGAYMEFVERRPLPQHAHLAASGGLREHHRRDGFEAASAKDIFFSTTAAAHAAQQQGRL
ncbi:hypothetical protein HT031_004114 [Scenedesmus sp. PABB004]|nr:hypothetical protein HT031_004114 [Scenedesmus sp. PABB004]